MQTGVQRSASAAGDLVCKPPLSCCQRMLDPAGRRGITGQSTCLVNRRSWVRIPAVPLEGVLEHHLGLSGFSIRERNANGGAEKRQWCRGAPVLLAIWFANHPSAAAKESWISRARGIAGQSACLLNRRSWVRIPAIPLNRWLCSAGSFLDRTPWQCLCFSNFIPIVQRPKDLVLPTHRARNLTPMDWHKEKNFVGLCGAMDSTLDF